MLEIFKLLAALLHTIIHEAKATRGLVFTLRIMQLFFPITTALFAATAVAATENGGSHARKLPEITETITTLILDNGAFDLFINYDLWLRSRGEVFVRANGMIYSNAHHPPSLVLQNITKEEGLVPGCGFQQKHIFFYGDVYGKLMLEASMILCGGSFTFESKFPNALNNTSSGNADALVSGFPTFEIDANHATSRGYAHFVSWYYNGPDSRVHQSQDKEEQLVDNDNDNNNGRKSDGRRRLLEAPGFTSPIMGSWSDKTKLSGGIGGTGVLSIFDKDSGDSLVFSALDNPMAVSSHSPRQGTLHYGVYGNCSEIPAGFTISVTASVGKGINDAFQHWGSSMRKYFGKQSLQVSRSMDISLQYLGYTTDNGAYYYYNTEPDLDYGTTLSDVKKYADSQKLPYKYILLDSWWYYKGENGGVSEWTAMDDVFPEGIDTLYQETGWFVQV